jgi:hydroxymethylbilane synthase
MTSKNLWTEELEELLIGGQLDFIVHSLKGMRSISLISSDEERY